MESVYFIKGRKLFGGVCGSSLNQTPFQMSHLIQGEIESGPRSSLVFKQPATISSQPVTTFESKHFFCLLLSWLQIWLLADFSSVSGRRVVILRSGFILCGPKQESHSTLFMTMRNGTFYIFLRKPRLGATDRG